GSRYRPLAHTAYQSKLHRHRALSSSRLSKRTRQTASKRSTQSRARIPISACVPLTLRRGRIARSDLYSIMRSKLQNTLSTSPVSLSICAEQEKRTSQMGRIRLSISLTMLLPSCRQLESAKRTSRDCHSEGQSDCGWQPNIQTRFNRCRCLADGRRPIPS